MPSDRSPAGDEPPRRGAGAEQPPEPGDEQTTAAGTGTAGETRREYAGAGVTAGVVVLFVLGLLLVLLIAQNAEAVPFELLWFDAEVSLAALLLAVAVGAVLVSELVGLIWRRRRRRMRTLRESAAGR